MLVFANNRLGLLFLVSENIKKGIPAAIDFIVEDVFLQKLSLNGSLWATIDKNNHFTTQNAGVVALLLQRIDVPIV